MLNESIREASWTDRFAYAKGDAEIWTPSLVKTNLVDAFRLLRRVGGRVGPGGLQAMWPEFQNNPEDYAQPEPESTRPPRSMTVTRMEMILLGWKGEDGRQHQPWLAGPLLEVPELRDKLRAWIFAELRGETSIMLCERKRWAMRSFTRHRDRAAGMIAQRLNIVGLEVWR